MSIILLNSEALGEGTAEILRARIAEILLMEFTEQQTLAASPSEFDVRVFEERFAPFQDFMNAPPKDPRAFVNVQFQQVEYLPNEGTVFEQAGSHMISVDVAAYAQTQDTDAGGQQAAGYLATQRVQQVANYVYRFLMSSHNVYLQLQGLVGWRRVSKYMMYQPEAGGMMLQGVMGARLDIEVKATQDSAERVHLDFDGATMNICRASDGELYIGLNS